MMCIKPFETVQFLHTEHPIKMIDCQTRDISEIILIILRSNSIITVWVSVDKAKIWIIKLNAPGDLLIHKTGLAVDK